ncbi:hypothetical protein K3495_g10333 [Podosphaera aphanis]|nr:hypothetical protein K3495_g10333 [Podosphaera aphanis]
MDSFDIKEMVSTAFPTSKGGPDGPIYQKVGDAGAKTLWVVFVIMLLSTITFALLSLRVPVQKRLFHVLTMFITLFAAISYFAMATGDGNSFVKHSNDAYRQVFWARYVDWVFTTPLLLLDLALLAGLDGASIIIALVFDVLMVLLGLFAGFARNNTLKWGYYTFSCIAYLIIVFLFAFPGRRAALARKDSTTNLFAGLGGFTLILWTLYPIVWGIGDGARLWSVDSEIISYAILDVLAKPVFGFWLLLTHSKNAESIEGFWSHGLVTEGAIRVGEDE